MRWTALLYAEAWATLDADSAHASLYAGRMARRSGEMHRAEVWYDRGYVLAARHRSRRDQIRALIGRGGLLREVGRRGEARTYLDRAARLASSTRRHTQAAEVQHEMLTIAAEEGQYAAAEVYVRAALREYPLQHPALPWLVHDWAFLIVRLGYYRQARVLLEAVITWIPRPDLLVVVWGTLGRAAAGAGRREQYEEARAWVVARISAHEEYAAAALAHLAVGAQVFREWDEAEVLASQAVEIARRRSQPDVERGAMEVLAAVRTRTDALPQATPGRHSRIQEIEHRMLARLRERGQPRGRKVERDPEAGGRPDFPPSEGQPTGPRTDPSAR